MENREEVLKSLFPEDILKISSGLTDGEIEVLKQLVELLESQDPYGHLIRYSRTHQNAIG